MSHELRTPLNAILGFSELMSAQVLGPLGSPKYADYCRDIHTSGQHLLNVISDVLDMARLEAGRVNLEYSDFAAGDMIRSAMQSIAPLTKANNISLRAEITGTHVLNADPRGARKDHDDSF